MSTPTATTESSMFPNAAEVEAEEAADIPRQYKRLSRSLLSHQGRWAFYVLRFDHGQQRAEITTRLQQDFGQAFTLWVTAEQFPRLVDLEVFLGEIGQQAARIELFGMDTWLDEARVREWNFRRDSFMQALSCPLLVWLTPGNLSLLATRAPDLWNWRTAIFDFCRGNSHITPDTFHNLADLKPLDTPVAKQPFARRAARIDELLDYLRQPKIQDRLADPVIVDLQLELAELLIFASRLDEAEEVLRKMPSHVESGHKYWIQANLAKHKGDLNTARDWYRHAEECYEQEQDGLGLANTLRSLGNLEMQLENFAEAQHHYQAARLLYEQEQHSMGLAYTLIGLALCAVYLKHPSQCSHYLQQAELAGKKSGVPHVLQYLATVREAIAQL